MVEQLGADLAADDALQACYHVGIGVRTYRRADDVVCILGVCAPVAYGLVGGILEGHVARGDGADIGSEHTHALDIDPLPLDVGASHVYHALHIHQRAHGGCGYAVLSGARLGDDAPLAHAAGDEDLAYCVVYLVCARMVQVLALEVYAASVSLRQALGQI